MAHLLKGTPPRKDYNKNKRQQHPELKGKEGRCSETLQFFKCALILTEITGLNPLVVHPTDHDIMILSCCNWECDTYFWDLPRGCWGLLIPQCSYGLTISRTSGHSFAC
ncbi:hypothetical protein XENTR_v10000459 [Xenopus tropicalis]|nr:hypothetical protein XENTR_v10000459 [Xenopus tropicalis]